MVVERSESAYETLSTVGTQQMEATNGCSSQSVSLVKVDLILACFLFRPSLM